MPELLYPCLGYQFGPHRSEHRNSTGGRQLPYYGTVSFRIVADIAIISASPKYYAVRQVFPRIGATDLCFQDFYAVRLQSPNLLNSRLYALSIVSEIVHITTGLTSTQLFLVPALLGLLSAAYSDPVSELTTFGPKRTHLGRGVSTNHELISEQVCPSSRYGDTCQRYSGDAGRA
jgi:hypothetical protein